MPGLAASKKIKKEIPNKMGGMNFLYSVLVTFNIIINIDKGKNTEPKYEILFAHNAISRPVDTDRKK